MMPRRARQQEGTVMRDMRDIARGATRAAASMAVAAGMVLATAPTPAYAKTEAEVSEELSYAKSELEAATANKKRLETEIDEAEQRITSITKALPDRREAAADTMRNLYKEMSIHNLQLDIILNSDNIEDVMDHLDALESIQATSFGQINGLSMEMAQCASDNVSRKEELETAKATVEKKTEEVASLERTLERIKNAPPAIEGCEPIDWSMSDEEIVAEWAPRIDAYLKGHGLEGHGEDFVRAGIKYGVDPRFSAAISNTESTRGDFVFASCNAWGFMGHSWDNWHDAIYDHTKYLSSSLYNGKLNAQTAQTYCPPTWQSWLSNTLSAAQSI